MISLQLFSEDISEQEAAAPAENAVSDLPEQIPPAEPAQTEVPEVQTKEAEVQGAPTDPMEPVLALLEKRYAVASGDRKGLANAIIQENLNREARREALTRQGADRLYDSWMRSADETRNTYPDFDLSAELKNGAFVRMLRSGVDVKTAYEVLHKDEIIPAAMQYAAKTVEARLAGAMASGSHRPAENGMGSHGAVVIGSPVSSLSRRDIADIAKRVERGERISFG